MGGIFGWIGEGRHAHAEAHAGVASAAMYRGSDFVAAMEGRPHWHSPELAALATQEGNARALAEAYRREGAGCLNQIGGAFALAVIDPAQLTALLAIDRMGMRPLCYASKPGLLVFGSDAETVAAHPRVGCRVSSQAVFDYLYSHVVPSPRSIFEDVYKLQPGECIQLRDGGLERRLYWQLRYRDKGDEPLERLEQRFRPLLREAVRRARGSEGEVGAFLSGGTDSSTVTGLLGEVTAAPPRTYSIGFAAEGFDEIGYARIAARHFGAQAREYYVTADDVVKAVPLIAAAYDEPFGNASVVPTYYCAKIAREEGISTLLAGDGGDELFGGNSRYATQRVFEAYAGIPQGLRSAVVEPLAFAVPAGDRLPGIRKIRSYIRQARVPLPDRLETYNFLHRSPLAEVFEADFLASVDVTAPLRLQREVYERASSRSPVNRMMHLDLKITLADNDLRKVTRAAALAGVEVRYPLLDDAIVAFSGEVPPDLKVRGLTLRYFFKHALRDFLPRETIAKSKHGFGLPFGLWLRTHAGLAELARESLAAFGERGIVRRPYIEYLLRAHSSGHATYYGVMIWVIMMLEQWLRAKRL